MFTQYYIKPPCPKKQFSVVLVIFRRMLVNPKLYYVKLKYNTYSYTVFTTISNE